MSTTIDTKIIYNANPRVKRDGVQHDWTAHQIDEYAKCMRSVEYFAKNYVKIINLDKGLISFSPYPYQLGVFDHLNKNRFSIILACRQSGKSITSVIWILWYLMFHPDKTVALLANKASTAREILARVILALENLPFFLQPGCKSLNKGSIEFSNNSRIIAASTSAASIRGMSANVIMLDEFAFVERDVEFYTSTYPVITSGSESKVIITSTANGIGNMFHKIYEGAVQGTNSYKPYRIDWWDVPGRDEAWKAETIANTSELQFAQEYGNSFLGTGNTLIDGNTLLTLRATAPIFENLEGTLKIYDNAMADRTYVMLVDVSKGRGQDYSTFNVIDVTEQPFKQVAVYRNNVISPLLFPDIIYKYAKVYNDAYVIVESNDCGAVVCNGLYYDLEYENMFIEQFKNNDAVGATMTKKVKRIGCSHMKDIIEANKLEIVDKETIIELSTFVESGNTWAASNNNHDDLVMNLVMFGWFYDTPYFRGICDINVKRMMYDEESKRIEDDVTPFGFIVDGTEEELVERVNGEVWVVDKDWGTVY